MADHFLEQQQQTIRLPLYSHEEQRTGHTQSVYPQDQLLMNCFPVITKDPLRDDKPVIKIQGRLGMRADSSTATLAGGLTSFETCYPKAMLTMTSISDSIIICYIDVITAVEYFVFVNYRPDADTFATIGKVPTTSPMPATANVHLSELNIDGTPYLGIVISALGISSAPVGNMSWVGYAASSAGAFAASAVTECTDDQCPPKTTYNRKAVGPLTQLNDVIYVMTEDGWIHGTVAASITSWDTLGKIQAISYPDRGMGLRRYKHHIVALGQKTIEFFNDEGIAAPALPISRTEQAFIKMGVVNQKACVNIDDVLWYVGEGAFPIASLYRLEGYTPVEITNAFHRQVLTDQNIYIDLQYTVMHGCKHIFLNNNGFLGVYWPGASTVPVNGSLATTNTINGQWVYCVDSNAWWFFSFSSENDFAVGGPTKIYFADSIASSGTVRRYAVTNMLDVADVGGAITNYAPRPLEMANQNEAGTTTGYHDVFAEENSTTRAHCRIPILIGTNSYDFETTARKFIRSAKIVGDKITDYAGAEPFTTFSSQGLYLGFAIDKTDSPTQAQSGAMAIERESNLVTETGYRYYFNNLGSGRNFKFFIWINGYVPIRLEALELVIAQGTH